MKKVEKIATHDFPVWRDKADFIIASRLGEELGIDDLLDWEQLWARKLNSDRFEICCIPFFIYGLALGDIVKTKPFGSRTYVVSEILGHSGRKTFRVFFQSLFRWNEIIDEITSLGCNVEVRWEKSKLIAIDAAAEIDCNLIRAYLNNLEKQNDIRWETGN